jgi:hypothetical protein
MRYVFFFTLIMAPLAASAQFQSNQVFLEGSFGYSRLPVGNMMNRFGTANFSVGLMASQKTAVLAGFNLAESKLGSSNVYTSSSQLSFFAGVRQFVTITEQIYFFGQGIVGYGDLMGDSFGSAGTFSANGAETVFLQASPGLMFFPKPRFAVTARIGSVGYKFSDGSRGSVFEVNGGSLRLGLLYRFGN